MSCWPNAGFSGPEWHDLYRVGPVRIVTAAYTRAFDSAS